ncbi:uncharacterized protein FIESC28_08610 [Fusarium coffeatum]|uniref:Nephrocystin 3-like N-terminal domain-containing protein n=1 Tax=Fusarium coffeatum TaxID=231269 RepID=A0A366R817_9HYPO|nr:uncharacterized protein FIESC28_08610 [Fusarium coffeatum]RBR12486.1 hypothetical protein FIESC28_08610 [Fusarium coffeatum]
MLQRLLQFLDGTDPTAGNEPVPDSPASDHAPRDSFHAYGENSSQNNNSGSGSQTNINHLHINSSTKSHSFKVDLMKALKVVNYRDGKDRYPSRATGTCQWVTRDPMFINWDLSAKSGLLSITADPGCGKSVLAKYLLEEELTARHSGENRIVCYFFSMDTPESMDRGACAIRCILHQVFLERPDLISPDLLKRLQTKGEKFLESINDLWKILINAARACRIVCVVDALDEFPNFGASLCHRLRELQHLPEGISLKFLATHRPYLNIYEALGPRREYTQMMLSEDAPAMRRHFQQDVDTFINERLEQIARRGGIEEGGIEILRQGVTRNANRTYLWVHLVLGWIETMQNLDQRKIRRLMCMLPWTLEEAYQEILQRSDERPGKRRSSTRDILMIVLAAQRTLTLREMLVLCNIHSKCQGMDMSDLGQEDFKRELKDRAALFISFVDGKIYLLHQTAKEFLMESNPDVTSYQGDAMQRTFQWKRSMRMDDCHGLLASLCMRYQALGEFRVKASEAKALSQAYAREHDLFEYAAVYWPSHYRDSSDHVQSRLQDRAEHLCSHVGGKLSTWFYVYWHIWESKDPVSAIQATGFTPLIAMCYLGLDRLVESHLRKAKYSLSTRDRVYKRTALTWASRSGFDQVVKLLLEARGSRWLGARVKLNSRDRHCWTALSHAVYRGHHNAIERLLQAGARQNITDRTGLSIKQLAQDDKATLELLNAYQTKRRKWKDWFRIISHYVGLFLFLSAKIFVEVVMLPVMIVVTFTGAIARQQRLTMVDNIFSGYGTFSQQQHMV